MVLSLSRFASLIEHWEDHAINFSRKFKLWGSYFLGHHQVLYLLLRIQLVSMVRRIDLSQESNRTMARAEYKHSHRGTISWFLYIILLYLWMVSWSRSASQLQYSPKNLSRRQWQRRSKSIKVVKILQNWSDDIFCRIFLLTFQTNEMYEMFLANLLTPLSTPPSSSSSTSLFTMNQRIS